MDILDQQAAEQIPPVVPSLDVSPIVEDIRRTADEKEKLLAEQEKILMEGVDTQFWAVIKQRLELRIHSLRSAQSLRLGNGPLDLQNIGLRAVIVNEIADGLQDVINLVEHPAKKRQAQLNEEEVV